jgi:hypothetical protein
LISSSAIARQFGLAQRIPQTPLFLKLRSRSTGHTRGN